MDSTKIENIIQSKSSKSILSSIPAENSHINRTNRLLHIHILTKNGKCFQDFYPLIFSKHATKLAILANYLDFWKKNSMDWFSNKDIDEENDELFIMKNIRYMSSNICNTLSLMIMYYHLSQYDSKVNGIKDINRNIIYKRTVLKLDSLNLHYLSVATHLALKILHNRCYIHLPIWCKLFILLVLRSNKSLKMKQLVLVKIYRILHQEHSNIFNTEQKSDDRFLITKFLKETILDINSAKIKRGFKKESVGINLSVKRWVKIEDILEYIPDEFSINLKMLVKNTNDNIVYNNIKRLIVNELEYSPNISTFAVSVSGGVSSMILSYYTKLVCNDLKKNLVLTHICYNNDDIGVNAIGSGDLDIENFNSIDICKSELEKDFIRVWANKLGCPLFIRNIDEIFYHENMKYKALYSRVVHDIQIGLFKWLDCPVLIGSNRNDCVENILLNLGKKVNYKDLCGLHEREREVFENKNIIILRPLLNVQEDDLKHMAVKHNIAYKIKNNNTGNIASDIHNNNNSTLRETLIPQINSFNQNILNGLYDYINYVNNLEEYWTNSFNDWTKMETIKMEANKIRILKTSFYHANYNKMNFWIKFFYQYFKEKYNDIKPSNETLIEFVNRLGKNTRDGYRLNNTVYKFSLNTKLNIEDSECYIDIEDIRWKKTNTVTYNSSRTLNEFRRRAEPPNNERPPRTVLPQIPDNLSPLNNIDNTVSILHSNRTSTAPIRLVGGRRILLE